MQKQNPSLSVSEEVLYNKELLFSILNYCDEKSRNENGMLLSKRHLELLTSNESFKWRCEQLHREYGIYHPPVLPTVIPQDDTGSTSKSSSPSLYHHSSWKALYLKHRKYKTLWMCSGSYNNDGDDDSHESVDKDDDDDQEDNFKIQVCARFKPKHLDHTNHNDRTTGAVPFKKKVTLPLHQRLALIRMNRNLSSNKHALRVLQSQGSWFAHGNRDEDTTTSPTQTDTTTISSPNSENCAISNNNDNRQQQPQSSSSATLLSENVQFLDTKHNSAIIVDRVKGLREFQFDSVMNDYVTQKHIYECSTMPLVTDFMNGHNATCLVYGQTGSGKTHTMFGPSDNNTDEDGPFLDISHGSTTLPESWGVIPRTCYQIMNALEFRSNTKQKNINIPIESQLSISYIEVYGNDVNDLLRNGKPCGHSRVSAQRYVLDGSSEMKVHSLNDILRLLNQGEKQKRVASTQMNDRSSRAHTLFILTLRQTCKIPGRTSAGASTTSNDTSTNNSDDNTKTINNRMTSRFILADLGGSEQIKKSQPFQYIDTNNSDINDNQNDSKERLRETVNINLGLLALKQCVKALRSSKNKNRKYKTVIPYADSKLTMLLSSGLGRGKNYSKTSIIVCASQHEDHVHETIDAMKFGQICKGIHFSSGGARKSTNQMLHVLLSTINSQIQECEESIRKYERWETKYQNYYDDHGNLVDTKQTTVVVGAEQYRQQLAQLIQQKMELTGDKIDNHLLYNEGHSNNINDNHHHGQQEEKEENLKTPTSSSRHPIGFGNMDIYTGIGV